MILRRLRGIAGTALLWALPWAAILGIVAAVAAYVLGAQLGPFRAFSQGALTGLYWGLASGALFGSALMLAEQNRGFTGLTRIRSAIWGAVAGMWFPALMSVAFNLNSMPLMVAGWPAFLVTGAMGALSGFATFWLAMRGETADPSSLPGDRPAPSLTGAPEPSSWSSQSQPAQSKSPKP